MKKLLAIVLAIALVFALSVAASAEGETKVTQHPSGSPQTATAVIRTQIDPSFEITIPGNTRVPFDAESTAFGTIQLTSARLNPNYAVKVVVTPNGTLKNSADPSQTIAYTIMNGNSAFSSAQYTDTTTKTELTINITEAAWNKAAAGSYSDTVNFTISYVNTTATR